MDPPESVIILYPPSNMVRPISVMYYHRGLPIIDFCLPFWHPNTRILQSTKHVVSLCTNLENFFVTNKDSVDDPTTLWAMHKAFMQGLLIQMEAREIKLRKQRHSSFAEIQTTDCLNNVLSNVFIC